MPRKPAAPAPPRTVAPMTLRPRLDLGGYASEVPLVAKLAGTVLDRPMTVFWGPNGCGKTTVLRMMAAVTGLVGSGPGYLPFGAHKRRLPSLKAAEGDIGILALAEGLPLGRHFRKAKAELEPLKERYDWPRGAPGVMDARALGWTGQRIWHYAGRDQITAGARTAFNSMEDMGAQIVRTLRSNSSSFGQMLMPEVNTLLRWAFAVPGAPGDVFDLPPPEKEAGSVNDVWSGAYLAPSIVYEACSGRRSGDPGRPEERWLLLDEPETGLSIPIQVRLFAALMRAAETGPARVFLASHSPLVLTMADSPLVQVVDMSGGWLEEAREAMRLLGTPAAFAGAGAAIEKGMRAAADKARREAEKERAARERKEETRRRKAPEMDEKGYRQPGRRTRPLAPRLSRD